ncbi:M28 family peptidase, partial [Acidobacteriota bacterium]
VWMNIRKVFLIAISLAFFLAFSTVGINGNQTKQTDEQKLLEVVHSISSHKLFDYVKELALNKYGGRLTGTQEYLDSANWVISHFKKWGISPGGDDNSFLQAFPNPYTLVFEDCEVSLHIPYDKDTIKKFYTYEDDFIPGSTSASGEITAEVVYVGYGITAPELSYDEYKGVDVKGKIVLMEREAPVSSDKDPELFKKWRPYSFHQYKLENAVAHGAIGMLYNYGPIANPNNAYDPNFIYSHVGSTVVADAFSGTGKDHTQVVEMIEKTLKPQSFETGKTFTIRNTTEHYPDGVAQNVIGLLEGSDPKLKEELIIIGGHLDHVGRCYEVMPGANDNASAVAVILGLAEALTKSPVKPKRTIMFNCFGAEEQAVAGAQYYVEHPLFPLEKTIGLINMDGVGCGDKLSALAAKNYPKFWAFIDEANTKYVHREINPVYFANNARPRLDAARFMWKGVPSISFGANGAPSFYHITKDDITTITPEIMEDLTQILFLAVLDMANQDELNFRE